MLNVSSPYDLSGLPTGTAVDVQVQSANVAGLSAWSAIATLTTGGVAAPNAPSITAVVPPADGTNDNLSVTWQAPPTDGSHGAATGYNLRDSPFGTGNWTTASGVTSPHTITGLAGGTAIDVEVQATNAATSPSAWSSVVTAMTWGATVPPGGWTAATTQVHALSVAPNGGVQITVTPAPTAVAGAAWSTSASVLPTTSLIAAGPDGQTNGWGQQFNAPATAGTYYLWMLAQGADGATIVRDHGDVAAAQGSGRHRCSVRRPPAPIGRTISSPCIVSPHGRSMALGTCQRGRRPGMEPVARVTVTVTFLRMDQAPAGGPPVLPQGYHVERVAAPTVGFYRYLYNTVGADYVWWLRRTMPDDELARLLCDPKVSIDVLYGRGEPAGFCELDARGWPDVNLSYFGLMPHAIGKGVGYLFLRQAVAAAWRQRPRGMTVNTCTADHPRALPSYLRAGFRTLRQVREVWNVPLRLGMRIPERLLS